MSEPLWRSVGKNAAFLASVIRYFGPEPEQSSDGRERPRLPMNDSDILAPLVTDTKDDILGPFAMLYEVSPEEERDALVDYVARSIAAHHGVNGGAYDRAQAKAVLEYLSVFDKTSPDLTLLDQAMEEASNLAAAAHPDVTRAYYETLSSHQSSDPVTYCHLSARGLGMLRTATESPLASSNPTSGSNGGDWVSVALALDGRIAWFEKMLQAASEQHPRLQQITGTRELRSVLAERIAALCTDDPADQRQLLQSLLQGQEGAAKYAGIPAAQLTDSPIAARFTPTPGGDRDQLIADLKKHFTIAFQLSDHVMVKLDRQGDRYVLDFNSPHDEFAVNAMNVLTLKVIAKRTNEIPALIADSQALSIGTQFSTTWRMHLRGQGKKVSERLDALRRRRAWDLAKDVSDAVSGEIDFQRSADRSDAAAEEVRSAFFVASLRARGNDLANYAKADARRPPLWETGVDTTLSIRRAPTSMSVVEKIVQAMIAEAESADVEHTSNAGPAVIDSEAPVAEPRASVADAGTRAPTTEHGATTSTSPKPGERPRRRSVGDLDARSAASPPRVESPSVLASPSEDQNRVDAAEQDELPIETPQTDDQGHDGLSLNL